MQKQLVVAGAVFVLLLGGGIVYLAGQPDEQPPAITQTTTADNQATSEPQPSQSASAGSYVDYQDGIISQTGGTKVLFFHAPWCPQCRALETDIKKSGVPDGVTIIKVDYDSNQKLRQQYGVTLQTTVVSVDDSGKLIKKFVAYDDPTVAAITKELL